MTSSGGVPNNSVIIENWLTSGDKMNKSINAWVRRWRTILSWEKGLPFQHLCKNTSGTPDIDRDIVLLPSEHYLRRTIVSRWNIASHLRILYTSKAKITDLQGIDYQLLIEIKKGHHTLRSQFSLTRMLLGFCDRAKSVKIWNVWILDVPGHDERLQLNEHIWGHADWEKLFI